MNDKLFEDMLLEIDTMTDKDYWALYHEAQNLPDFPPPEDPYYSVVPTIEIIYQFDSIYSNSEDAVCLMVA
jgi:hypothetical protein